ncbi:Virulence protein RhuM family protein [Desulfuromusa kysingii]|uniref:Virulence protein RhuM family protein n=1 Tax=Desulfuromusa kysingii TaxID=37625 RepID=A0A1H4AFT6_9BACT|nr:Virulence protein RhuM family protein [Desulfuromusa kysingii]
MIQAATAEESSVVQNEGGRQVRRKIQFYNLDVIISVGYRVKSLRGTQFRQGATRILREHLVKGYTVNEQRLQEDAAKFRELQKTVDLLTRTLKTQQLVTDTGEDVLRVISDGNKRIAAALFVYFLVANDILYRPDGSKRLADNALVALTLLIAESRPEEKETIVKVIITLINWNND